MFDGDSVNLLSLMGKLSNDMGVGDRPRARVLAYILVHVYCFSEDFGVPFSGNFKLIDVVMQMEDRRSPITLILAETMIDLDTVKADKEGFYRKSLVATNLVNEEVQSVSPPSQCRHLCPYGLMFTG